MTLPHTSPPEKYNSISEVRDMILHIERVAVGIRSGLYDPVDSDFKELSIQLFSLAQQLKTFLQEKQQLVQPEMMY